MIIVSQDKSGIYNFDNIKSIDAIGNEVTVTDSIMSNRGVVVGIYVTEERAKEVLREIAETRAITEIYKCCNNEVQNIFDRKMLKEKLLFDTYEMPEE